MKILILTTVMASYRVMLFNQLGTKCDLTVCFEQKNDETRDSKWYERSCGNFKCIFLEKWDKSIKTIKFDIFRIVKEEKPDMVIAYEYSTNTAMLLMSYCKIAKIPYIINCDGAFIKHSCKDIAKKHYIKNADGYLASGNMAKKYFLDYGAKEENIYFHKFTTLKESDILTDLPSKEDKNELKRSLNIKHERNILCVGRFIPCKGIDVLLKSVPHMPKDIGVYIIGGNPCIEYKNIVKEYALNNVCFLDFMKPNGLKKYFMACDLFVLPTRSDVWGLVINEAMSFGMPVVTTDKCVAGIELIENGINGYIVPTDNPEEIARVVNFLLENENLMESIKHANLKKIKEYTIEKSAKSIFDNISKVYSKSVNDNERK